MSDSQRPTDEEDWFSAAHTHVDEDVVDDPDPEPSVLTDDSEVEPRPVREDDTDQFPVSPPVPSLVLPRGPAGVATPKSSWFRRNRSAVAVGGAVATVVVIGLGAVLAFSSMSSGDESPTPLTDLATSAAPPSSSTPTAAPAAANAWCKGFSPRELATPESSDAGMSVISNFQSAFYAGDAVKARSYVAPDNSIGSVEQLTKGFGELPVGSEACVLASPVGNGRYEVDLYERHPDGSNVKYRQTVVTTGAPDGSGARIVAINPREGQ